MLLSNFDRRPAFKSVRPIFPSFKPVGVGEAGHNLKKYLGCRGELFAMTNQDDEIKDFYLLNTDRNKIFIKVVPAQHLKKQLLANDISVRLRFEGIQTSCLLPGFPIITRDQSAILGYAYISGRFATDDRVDLIRLGSALAKTHSALFKATDRQQIEYAYRKQAKRLNQKITLIRQSKDPFSQNQKLLKDLLTKDSNFLIQPNFKRSQPIHGDMVFGNVIYDEFDNVTLLDFEDATSSWLPIEMDLVKVLERFIFSSTGPKKEWWVKSNLLLSSYSEASAKPRFLCHKLYECLKFINLHALVKLAIKEDGGLEVNDSEWQKFFNLILKLEDVAPTLKRLDELYVEKQP